MKSIRLYHACKSREAVEEIMSSGFRGTDVWDHNNCVFFASKPLDGFGGWSEQWIEIEIPVDIAQQNDLYTECEKETDADNYKCECFCFSADFVNNQEFYLHLDEVKNYK